MSRVSRRSAMVGFCAGLAAVPVASKATTNGNEWAPTELGRELMGLLPTYIKAVYDDCNTVDAKWAPGYDPQKVAAVERAVSLEARRLDSAAKEILKRPVTTCSHLTDRAIIYCVWDDKDGWHEVEEKAARSVMRAILNLAGLDRRNCSIELLYEEYKRSREASPVLSGGHHA